MPDPPGENARRESRIESWRLYSPRSAETFSELLTEVERRTGRRLAPGVMTLGFARRATAYKRSDLLFSGLDRLKRIASQVGPLQVIYGARPILGMKAARP